MNKPGRKRLLVSRNPERNPTTITTDEQEIFPRRGENYPDILRPEYSSLIPNTDLKIVRHIDYDVSDWSSIKVALYCPSAFRKKPEVEGEQLLATLVESEFKLANLDLLRFYAKNPQEYPRRLRWWPGGKSRLYVYYFGTILGQKSAEITHVGYTAWDNERGGLEVDLQSIHNFFFRNQVALAFDSAFR